jgi:hypothetical protein
MYPKTSRHTLVAQAAIRELDPAKLSKAEADIPALASETRKARLATALDSPEESLVSLVKPLESGALQRYRQLRPFRIASPPFRQPLGLVEKGDPPACLLVRTDPLFEGRVVQFALGFQDALKSSMLSLAWQKTESASDDH